MIPKLIVGKYIVLFLVYLNLSLLPWLILPRDQHGASQDGNKGVHLLCLPCTRLIATKYSDYFLQSAGTSGQAFITSAR